jgi:hypothetical protein
MADDVGEARREQGGDFFGEGGKEEKVQSVRADRPALHTPEGLADHLWFNLGGHGCRWDKGGPRGHVAGGAMDAARKDILPVFRGAVSIEVGQVTAILAPDATSTPEAVEKLIGEAG